MKATIRMISRLIPVKLFPVIQLTKTNTKQFPKLQLFDLEVLKQIEKGLEKNNLPPNLFKMAVFNLIQNFCTIPMTETLILTVTQSLTLHGQGFVYFAELYYCQTNLLGSTVFSIASNSGSGCPSSTSGRS